MGVHGSSASQEASRDALALAEGRAFVETSQRLLRAEGEDSVDWLNDLVSSDVASLRNGEAARTLLLSPSGRIRADLRALRVERGFLLLQGPDQAEPVDDILRPYVLSSRVELFAREPVPVFTVSDRADPPPGGWVFRPSVFGMGSDLVVPPGNEEEVRARLSSAMREVEVEAATAWRVWLRIPLFPADMGVDPLPAEAGLDRFVDLAKGCFLGQESARMVHERGRPAFRVVAAAADGPVAPGETVVRQGQRMGSVTSAALTPEGWGAMVRLRGGEREGELVTATGATLTSAPLFSSPA